MCVGGRVVGFGIQERTDRRRWAEGPGRWKESLLIDLWYIVLLLLLLRYVLLGKGEL